MHPVQGGNHAADHLMNLLLLSGGQSMRTNFPGSLRVQTVFDGSRSTDGISASPRAGRRIAVGCNVSGWACPPGGRVGPWRRGQAFLVWLLRTVVGPVTAHGCCLLPSGPSPRGVVTGPAREALFFRAGLRTRYPSRGYLSEFGTQITQLPRCRVPGRGG